MGGGHGSEGLVVGHDGLRRGDHAEEKPNAANEKTAPAKPAETCTSIGGRRSPISGLGYRASLMFCGPARARWRGEA